VLAHEAVQRARALAAAQHDEQRRVGIEAQLGTRRGDSVRIGREVGRQGRPHVRMPRSGRSGHRRLPRMQDARGEAREPGGRAAGVRVDLEQRHRDAESPGRQHRGQGGEAAKADEHLGAMALQRRERLPVAGRQLEDQPDARWRAATLGLDRQDDALARHGPGAFLELGEHAIFHRTTAREPDEVRRSDPRLARRREDVQAGDDVAARAAPGEGEAQGPQARGRRRRGGRLVEQARAAHRARAPSLRLAPASERPASRSVGSNAAARPRAGDEP
jgi:hypothetical protein